MILAIDTTAGTSAAVVSDGKILGFSGFEDPFGHAENIGRSIETALQQAAVDSESIQAVAISRGPASYTGLRVGMSAGVAFSTGRGIPLYGVVSLDAVASLQKPETDSDHWIVCSDAKRGELFVALYSGFNDAGLPIRDGDPQVLKPAEVEEKYRGIKRIANPCDAKAVGIYAEKALATGLDMSEVSALYLRSPDVTPSAGKRVSG